MAGLLARLFGRVTKTPSWVEAAELKRRLTSGAVLLVDVRQPDEFIAPPGHLPGAINVPLNDLPARIHEIAARGQPIVTVCKTDRRSARAAVDLLAASLSDVAVLRGGTDGWHAKGFELE